MAIPPDAGIPKPSVKLESNSSVSATAVNNNVELDPDVWHDLPDIAVASTATEPVTPHDETDIADVPDTGDDVAEDLEALRQSLPSVPRGMQSKNGWTTAKEFSEKVDYDMAYLKKCRSAGVKTKDKAFGKDSKGNIWGKAGTNSRTVFYHES